MRRGVRWKGGQENCWFTLTCCRSTEMAKLPGGVSTLYKYALQLFFGDGSAERHNVRAGVTMDVLGKSSIAYSNMGYEPG